MKSQSFNIKNVYIDSIGIIVSKKEKNGPLGRYFNRYIDDYYFKEKTFEKAQSKLAKAAINIAIKKSSFKLDNIDISIGGDLSNQIFSSTSAIKEQCFPFIGLYAACASGILGIIISSIMLNLESISSALVFSSSHVCVSQRQLRYPIEYASIAKKTTTSTLTGACALILANNKNKFKISKATIGRIIDILSNNVNDMGTCMAFAAIDTFINHLTNNKETDSDYDLIVTGDLSKFGSSVFLNELTNKGYNIKDKYYDCGNLVYDDDRQNTYAGGSGPACVMCVTFSYIINQMIKNNYKKVLVIGTGALHSQISFQQKESIPCIAHAIVLEVDI